MNLTPEQWKQAIISILVGACVAFVTTLLQGLADWLRGVDYITGPMSGISYYLVKTWKLTNLG